MPFKDYFAGPSTSLDDQIESFATTRVPDSQRWRRPAILLVLTGNITAMFWFILGGQIGSLVGWPGLLLPISYLVIGATLVGSVVMRMASQEGLSLPLLTRGLGFGVKGSAIASLIYGVNFVFYFIFEGSIVSHAISEYAGIAIDSFWATVVFAAVALVTLYFAWRGMHSMNVLQRFGAPIFLVLFAIGIYMLANGYELVGPGEWKQSDSTSGTAMWQAFSLVNGQVVFQALIATDYGRFVKRKVSYAGTAGVMFVELIAIVPILLIGVLFTETMVRVFTDEGRPTAVLDSIDPGLYFAVVMGLLGVVFAIITQVRINVMNLYSGSLALANANDAVSPRKVGRQWWMVGLIIAGIACYPLNVLQYLDKALAVTGIMTNTWIFIVLADYFVCRKLLKLAPSGNIEYRDGFLVDWNPCGIISMVAGLLVGAAGIFELYPSYYASFAAMIVGPLVHIPLTALTKGRFYERSSPAPEPAAESA
ncbi:allantoin permease [Rhodococcus sp. Leaf7]|nr:allantoin permease [Rhodococcus sp. Leaf7]KQU43401.1 allantoin permease [Rhodococcus sp. Leaf247]